MSSSEQSHSRRNLLTGEWVLVSPHRMERPWQGQTEAAERDQGKTFDPDCYLCPGNARASGKVNPDYNGAYVFENDFSALTPGSGEIDGENTLLESRAEPGECRVVCYTRRHDQRLATMSVSDIEAALHALNEEFESLDRRNDIGYVQVFENRGRMMGCSNPHPHAQIWATKNLPTEVDRELREQRRWLETHRSVLLADYRDAELKEASRVITSNEHFVALVPYWATWPFETMLLPKRFCGATSDLSRDEISALARILAAVLGATERLFDAAVPYSMGFHPRPSDGETHPEWLFHIHICPPLLRSANVAKHMVGFEMFAMPQRDITPERAAELLRDHC